MSIVEVSPVAPYLSVENVERYFGINRRKIWALLADKRIRGSRTNGRKWVVNTDSIIKYLKHNENKGE